MGLCSCWMKCCLPLGLVRKYSSRMRNRKIVLLLLGLDNSGKSSTANGLIQEPVEAMIPTVGFNVVRLKHQGYTVIIYDLGGGPQIRGIWPQYYVDAYGLIYVVDASDLSRIEENRKVLEKLLAHEKIAGKPVLLLANKQDREGALDELDIVEKLRIESLVNQQRCPTLVETCSAGGPTIGRRRKIDPGIYNGYRWLLRRIINDYESLHERVNGDMEKQKIIIEEARKEWKKKQQEKPQVDNSPEESLNGNPFKPIHMLVEQMENREGKTLVMLKPMNGFAHSDQVESLEGITSTETLSSDSPDSSSQDINENSQSQSSSAVTAVKEQLEWKEQQQRRRLRIKNNRTAPLEEPSVKENTRILPPLKHVPHTCSWARPSSCRSFQEKGPTWDLQKSLDVVDPPRDSTTTEGSDSEDVIIAKR